MADIKGFMSWEQFRASAEDQRATLSTAHHLIDPVDGRCPTCSARRYEIDDALAPLYCTGNADWRTAWRDVPMMRRAIEGLQSEVDARDAIVSAMMAQRDALLEKVAALESGQHKLTQLLRDNSARIIVDDPHVACDDSPERRAQAVDNRISEDAPALTQQLPPHRTDLPADSTYECERDAKARALVELADALPEGGAKFNWPTVPGGDGTDGLQARPADRVLVKAGDAAIARAVARAIKFT